MPTADCPSCGEELDLDNDDATQDAEFECDACGEPLRVDIDLTSGTKGVMRFISTAGDDLEEDL